MRDFCEVIEDMDHIHCITLYIKYTVEINRKIDIHELLVEIVMTY